MSKLQHKSKLTIVCITLKYTPVFLGQGCRWSFLIHLLEIIQMEEHLPRWLSPLQEEESTKYGSGTCLNQSVSHLTLEYYACLCKEERKRYIDHILFFFRNDQCSSRPVYTAILMQLLSRSIIFFFDLVACVQNLYDKAATNCAICIATLRAKKLHWNGGQNIAFVSPLIWWRFLVAGLQKRMSHSCQCG